MDRLEFINKRVLEHYNEACSLGYEVVGVFLQGSQNYGLDEYSDAYMSDIDTKCIILPSLDDIIAGSSPLSHTHVRQNNEHIDIKDIRQMFEMFKKQNNAYVEILFTDFKIINPKYKDLWEDIEARAEQIAHLNFNQTLRCLCGTSMEKYKALEHPYPNTMDKIEKYGYDPKQLHHILRVNDFMHKYVDGKPYRQCLYPDNVQYLMAVKKGSIALEDARKLAHDVDQATKELKDASLIVPEPVNSDAAKFLDNVKAKFIKRFLVDQLRKML